jgi:hypothetical protein
MPSRARQAPECNRIRYSLVKAVREARQASGEWRGAIATATPSRHRRPVDSRRERALGDGIAAIGHRRESCASLTLKEQVRRAPSGSRASLPVATGTDWAKVASSRPRSRPTPSPGRPPSRCSASAGWDARFTRRRPDTRRAPHAQTRQLASLWVRPQTVGDLCSAALGHRMPERV